jgi:hypothetical protein
MAFQREGSARRTQASRSSWLNRALGSERSVGFSDWHESSLDLRTGLEVTEHDWNEVDWQRQHFPELRLAEDWSKLVHAY